MSRAPEALAIAATAIVLLSGCSYLGSSSSAADEVSCDDVLASAVNRMRADDTSAAIDQEFDWLSQNCPVEYDIATDYAAVDSTLGIGDLEACDFFAERFRPESVVLLRADGLCVDAVAVPPPSWADGDGGDVSWDDAINHVGTVQRVCGPLAGDGQDNDDVFLNLGLDYPDPERFQIVVWDVGALEPIPYGSKVCTTGLISTYNGVVQIEVETPSAVEYYE